jgi:hypothetical protein
MKILLIPVLLTIAMSLQAQNITFSKLIVGESDKFPVEMLELPNSDLILTSIENSINANKSNSKIYFLSENGRLKDSIIFKDSLRSLAVYKIIPTSYGYCLLGSMKEGTQYYFWNAKLDAQFRITNQQFTPTNLNKILTESYTITRDSELIVIIPFLPGGIVSCNIAKINKKGELNSYITSGISNTSIPIAIFERKDSSGYLLLDDFEWIVTDSLFNTRYKKNLNLTLNGVNYSPNFQPTGVRKNDSTYFYAGRWLEFNGRRNRDLVFMVINTLGQQKFAKSIIAGGDTSYTQAGIKCIDTTKDARFIYWGGSKNYDILNPTFSMNQGSLILTKLDSSYQIVWQKQYGTNAYYQMVGVLATKDGGCMMYGRRYDYNNIPKTDAIIIKVDGNGVVTSTTTIPMLQSSIIAYPNPSNGLLNFKKGDPSVSGTFEVNIFDISGKLVFQKRETDLSETFDLSNFAEGDYIYQIKQQGQIISVGKWVKIK